MASGWDHAWTLGPLTFYLEDKCLPESLISQQRRICKVGDLNPVTEIRVKTDYFFLEHVRLRTTKQSKQKAFLVIVA